MWLYIHRPFEVWPALGAIQIERMYMILIILYWLFYPGKGWVSNRLNRAFLTFSLVLMTCWLTSPYGDLGARVVEDHLKVVVFYILVISTVRDESSLRKLVLFYLLSMGLYMTHSLWEYVHGRHEFRMSVIRMIGVDKSFNDPNTFAATILYSLTVSLPFWSRQSPLWGRGLLVYYSCLSIGCILLTGSRAGFVGLSCLGVLCAWNSKHRLLYVGLLALAFCLGWPLLPQGLQNRFLTLLDPSVGPANARMSAEGRIRGFSDGIELWEKYPYTGVGPGSFGKAVGHGFQAHNLYGQTLGELGILGAVALAGILLAFARNRREANRLQKNLSLDPADFPYRLSRSISLCVLLLLIMGFGGHNLYRYTWLWFGAFQAVALHCLRLQTPSLGEEHDWLIYEDDLETDSVAAGFDGDAVAGRWHPNVHPV
jgi:O-antigen ligase